MVVEAAQSIGERQFLVLWRCRFAASFYQRLRLERSILFNSLDGALQLTFRMFMFEHRDPLLPVVGGGKRRLWGFEKM